MANVGSKGRIKRAQEAAEDARVQEHQHLAERLHLIFAVTAAGLEANFNQLQESISGWNTHQGFWQSDNSGEKIALMHSELSEALEADRKDLPSDKLEGFSGVEEELADTVIRILDFAGYHDLRLAEAVIAKLQHNLTRPYMHGKKY